MDGCGSLARYQQTVVVPLGQVAILQAINPDGEEYAAQQRAGDDPHPCDAEGATLYGSGVTLVETWQAMERLVDTSQCRSIGLSDIGLDRLREIVAVARIKPGFIPRPG